MKLIQTSPEVFLAPGPIAEIGASDIAMLREAARAAPKRRARINTHGDGADPLHEMIIALAQDTYIRPHKHPAKSESFHIIEGAVDIVVLDDAGEIVRVVSLSRDGSFFYRMSRPLFHTLLIRSELLVIHETTNGPFDPAGTVFAAFAPPDTDGAAATAYIAGLEARVAGFAGGAA